MSGAITAAIIGAVVTAAAAASTSIEQSKAQDEQRNQQNALLEDELRRQNEGERKQQEIYNRTIKQYKQPNQQAQIQAAQKQIQDTFGQDIARAMFGNDTMQAHTGYQSNDYIKAQGEATAREYQRAIQSARLFAPLMARKQVGQAQVNQLGNADLMAGIAGKNNQASAQRAGQMIGQIQATPDSGAMIASSILGGIGNAASGYYANKAGQNSVKT